LGNTVKIRMIGYGRLAKAMAEQIAKKHQLIVSSPSLTNGTLPSGIATRSANTADLINVDMVILAVKPQLIATILTEITPHLPTTTVIISLAAGVDLQLLQQLAPQHKFMVRAMPNINAQVQASMTLLLQEANVAQHVTQMVEQLFLTLGTIAWLENDKQMDIATIFAGSGPAFACYFMQACAKMATSLGLDADLSNKLILNTFAGSVELAATKNLSFADIITQVASPNGITAAALARLDMLEVQQRIEQGLLAAWQRLL